jgi:hypothetical protein
MDGKIKGISQRIGNQEGHNDDGGDIEEQG